MLWGCDLNLVRGKTRWYARLGGPAHGLAYLPQHDNAHHDKLNAFLNWLDAPESLRRFHHAWNGMTAPQTLPFLNREVLDEWAHAFVQPGPD